ncbi:MAG: hypothetical protein NTU49_01520 [Gammaproteobacteria bacterium]|nr:hypothetical protein [Gammaproteobacteria bacterium]
MPIETDFERHFFLNAIVVAGERRDWKKLPPCHFDSIYSKYKHRNLYKAKPAVLDEIWKKLKMDTVIEDLKKDPKKAGDDRAILIGDAVIHTVRNFSSAKKEDTQKKSPPTEKTNEVDTNYEAIEFIISQVPDGQPLKILTPLIAKYRAEQRLFKTRKETLSTESINPNLVLKT